MYLEDVYIICINVCAYLYVWGEVHVYVRTYIRICVCTYLYVKEVCTCTSRYIVIYVHTGVRLKPVRTSVLCSQCCTVIMLRMFCPHQVLVC